MLKCTFSSNFIGLLLTESWSSSLLWDFCVCVAIVALFLDLGFALHCISGFCFLGFWRRLQEDVWYVKVLWICSHVIGVRFGTSHEREGGAEHHRRAT